MNYVRPINLNLKYQKFTPSDCKGIGILKFEFVAKTQQLYLDSYFDKNQKNKSVEKGDFVRNFRLNVHNCKQNIRIFKQNVHILKENVRNFEENVRNFEENFHKFEENFRNFEENVRN